MNIARFPMLTQMRHDIAIRVLPGWLLFGAFLNLAWLEGFNSLSAAALAFWVPWLPAASYLAHVGMYRERVAFSGSEEVPHDVHHRNPRVGDRHATLHRAQ